MINFEYHDVTSSEALEAYTTSKLDSVFRRSDQITGVDVYFKVQDAALPQDRMTAGIRVELPGETLFAESVNDTFHKSISSATDEVLGQLQRYKEKQRSY